MRRLAKLSIVAEVGNDFATQMRLDSFVSFDTMHNDTMLSRSGTLSSQRLICARQKFIHLQRESESRQRQLCVRGRVDGRYKAWPRRRHTKGMCKEQSAGERATEGSAKASKQGKRSSDPPCRSRILTRRQGCGQNVSRTKSHHLLILPLLVRLRLLLLLLLL